MGIVKPPWISQYWFRQCPFNYCDHFGNKRRLSEVCLICKDELERLARYKKEGKDPNDMKNVFKDLEETMTKTLVMVTEEAKHMGVDLDKIEDDYEESEDYHKNPLFKLVLRYGFKVEAVINNLSEVPVNADRDLLIKAVDAFSHSRHYVIAKIGRAISSRWEEENDPEDKTLDAKTSAFLAYIAVIRNSQAALALAAHKPMAYAKSDHLKFAKVSIEVADIIKKEFFQKEELAYKEFGCEEYEEIFNNA